MGVITFNGVNSSAFGIEVSSPPRYTIPEEDVSQLHVLGRNGDSIHRYQSFKNIQVTYPITYLVPKYQYGDVDLDGLITPADASAVLRHVARPQNYPLTNEQLILADVNPDGVIDDFDAYEILKSVASLSDLEFKDPSVNLIASRIAGWLHPYFPEAKLENRQKYYMVTGKFLSTRDGYSRLVDTYNPGFFRKAICKNAIDVVNVYEQGGIASIVFECTPEKWYVSGETWTSGETIDQPEAGDNVPSWYPVNAVGVVKGFQNPSLFGARPMIRISYDRVVPDYWGQCYGIIKILNIPNQVLQIDTSTSTPKIKINWDYYGLVNEKTVTFKIPTGTRPRAETNQLYIDFQNGMAYGVAATYPDVTPKVYDVFKHNDCVTSRIYKDTGLFTPGYNAVFVEFVATSDYDGPAQNFPSYPNFEILPRWWTL